MKSHSNYFSAVLIVFFNGKDCLMSKNFKKTDAPTKWHQYLPYVAAGATAAYYGVKTAILFWQVALMLEIAQQSGVFLA